MIRKLSSLSSSSSLPSLATSEGSPSEHPSRQSSMAEESLSLSSSLPLPSKKSPTWLTDGVVKAVFGHTTASDIPSPIHTCEKSPGIPHIFLGCQEEMFGLNFLDTFFCSASYCELLNSIGIESRYTAVQSDHWNILNSAELSDALGRELRRIELECSMEK
mmetsp:Transcript_25930/g.44280  ORF Transcript_25930/g.44280 Transcript_25930/m.44280 type:complete len:161 (-) Transcript_25930:149-631(-)